MTEAQGLDVLNIVVNGGAFGLLAYAFIYLFPSLVKHQLAQWKEIELAQAQSVRDIVQLFREEQKAERQQCSEQFGSMMNAFSRLADAVGQNQSTLSSAIGELGHQISIQHELSKLAVQKLSESTPNKP